MHAFLLFFICTAISQAEESKLNGKWDFEVREVSRKFEKEMYPKGNIDTPWAASEYNKKSGLLAPGVPKQYRHMHAMVVAAFYAKRADHRETAMKWIKDYECENILACKEFHQFYEGALKSNILTMKKKSTRIAAESIREKVKEREKSLASQMPQPFGLCAPASRRAEWLALEYQVLCPRNKVPGGVGFCPGCTETKDLEFKLGVDSQQMVMSSSYLDSFEHKGAADCSTPWEVVMKCGGVKNVTYSLQCERKNESDPPEITCKEK